MKRKTEQVLDQWLVASAQAGEQAAFTRLLQRWGPKLLGYARTLLQDDELASDVVQETLMQLTRNLTTLRDPASFPKWIYQILQRRCADEIQRRQKQRKLQDHLLHMPQNEQVSIEQALSVSNTIKCLPWEWQQVVRLYYVEGFSIQEMAEILEIPAGTVKSRLFSARQHLKRLFEENDDDNLR